MAPAAGAGAGPGVAGCVVEHEAVSRAQVDRAARLHHKRRKMLAMRTGEKGAGG